MMFDYVPYIVNIPTELDEEFREVIRISEGRDLKRGDIKDSLLEAIHDWIRKKRQGQ
jgi:hypothetical protein